MLLMLTTEGCVLTEVHTLDCDLFCKLYETSPPIDVAYTAFAAMAEAFNTADDERRQQIEDRIVKLIADYDSEFLADLTRIVGRANNNVKKINP